MNQVQDKVQVKKQMREFNAYLDLMYYTLYKPRADEILEMHAGK